MSRVKPRRGAIAVATTIATFIVLAAASSAGAAVTCPNSNPVLSENFCSGAGTTAYVLNNPNENIGGYATQTSFNRGQAVPLKIARNAPVIPSTRVDISVYRMGYYGGLGARLMPGAGATGVTVNNSFACNAENATTGELDCSNWNVTYTIPASSLPASGVYLAKLRTTDTGWENWIVFIVRDDARAAKVLDVLPTASWQAYNTWGGKSLYYDKNGGVTTVAGTQRAVKVSFNRPLDNPEASLNRFPGGPDFDLLFWLERQGYDVAYTDDVSVHGNPTQLRTSGRKVVAISGHSEYWSLEEYNAVKAARDAGVAIASFSANTAYWKVRYENGTRRLVCYKTVEGSGSGGSGTVSANDWGPDGVQGTADDALGADGQAGTADDRPDNSTTTFRDNGAPPGDPNAPPGGRVGPDLPENALFGVMYFGDNDSFDYPLTVTAANGAGEFAGDRIWRNTGIAPNTATSIGTNTVGWEWDAVPTQAQYLAKQPSGVKRLSASNVTAQQPSWLQDEGRLRATTPPPGQPGTVNAVKYRAASGAWVFATGTMNWSRAFGDTRIDQATYNMLSDMGVQPGAPDGITLDPTNGNQPPVASFTVTPATNPVPLNQAIQFNASGSTDADGTITKYEWDLDGNGTYETDTGTTKTTSKTYTTEGTFDVGLRVTDNGAATDFTVRTVVVLGNQPPTAAFTASPNPAVVTQTVTFNGSGSSDPDGTITKYEWDLDGNGTYETNTGTTKTTTKAFATAGTVTVGLRVTDNGGKTATATVPVTVNSGGVSNYGDAVLDTPGLVDYWRMGEATGTTLADSKGTSPGTLAGGATLGVPGGPPADPNTAVRFDGLNGTAKANLNLAGAQTITVEFWLKWNAYANNDALAMEYTANFNDGPGGFLVDPNAPQANGSFGIGLGQGGSRNNAFFARPSAGVWHHYALVLDATAAAAAQITPYVDGQAVTYSKTESGTGAGAFANSALNLMSRNGTTLFGAGDLDEVAIYNRALTAAQISEHAASFGTNRRPNASFTISPNPASTGQTVTFNGSGSTDSDGSITRYQWDLDGNGTYETDSGSNPQTTKSYAADGDVAVGLKVTDDQFGADTATKTLKVGAQPPVAAFTAAPNPGVVDQAIAFDASGSSDPDGTITKYEWDLDGNGSYETNTGTTKTTSKAYAAAGTVTVGLRVTDNAAKTATATVPVTVNNGGVSNYGDTVLDTPGLVSYWRMGETSGTTLADSKGTSPGTLAGGTTLGVQGGPLGDPNKAVRFDGINGRARANLDLSGTSKVTVEFWLNWKAYANNDALAMEFTDNFNNGSGGFLIDPNAPQQNGTFGVGIGDGGSRNNAFFTRPSAGAWHHYAFVLDTTAAAASQITPYVDGQAVAYTKMASGTGAGAFANAALNMMSRAGTALFGAGDLDEVAIYNRALTAAQISEHATSYGTNRRPNAAFTLAPNPAKTSQTVTFNGSGSNDPDGTITKYEWDLDGNGSFETSSGSNAQTTRTYAAEQNITVRVRVTDNQGGTDTESHDLVVGNSAPTASFTVTPSVATVGQTVALDATASADGDGTIAKYEWDLDGNGSYETDTGTTKTTSRAYTAPANLTLGLRVTDDDGATATATRSLSVRAADYSSSVLATAGLRSYWRLGETSGTTFADSKGASPATRTGVTLGVAGALAGDANAAARFNGTSDFAQATMNLSDTSTVTIEFWLKWNAWANDDDLALEFTDNFNASPGGFLIDPNSSDGSFGIGLGVGGSRNNAFFLRPTAGAWHHYAIALDTTAAAVDQIKAYVDGQPVAVAKGASGTGAGAFANSTLSFMSRAGSALFGAGDLDELAIYDRVLPAGTIADHFAAGAP